MVTLRQARSADYRQLFELYEELNPLDPAPDTREWLIFEKILNNDDLILFVAESTNQLLATCYLNIIPNLTRGGYPYALIENVVTRASHRHQGIGKQLLLYAQAHAWSRDCYKIMLLTGSEDESTHAFYLACGFSGDMKHGYIIRR
ncbi:GNAT family N-acetyltransferase [Franzmannia qiaohouensis]|uniref:GNAT family N-acetyltransferase n=1 Tax=Franzmannia qiaohouensis TaxID=1329370 RepID=A0ABU1HBY8_9GAMM|nr:MULTISPECIES: GNAT family N-acetyltransferase [Halomonas]MDR5904155.1 GNAT family N-acetyltransferase [Halomonas qiaohouensis]